MTPEQRQRLIRELQEEFSKNYTKADPSKAKRGTVGSPETPGSPSFGSTVRKGLDGIDVMLGLSETAGARSDALLNGYQKMQGFFGVADDAAAHNTRMAAAALKGNGWLATGLKWAPAVGAGLSAADLVLGDESWANKGMDAALMTAGGVLGSAVPVIGTGLGITAGKLVSDGAQFLFGGGESPEDRKLREALALLESGRLN